MIKSRLVFAALYAAAVMILLDQLSQLLIGLTPIRLEAVGWRFGAVGIAATRASPFLIADTLILLAAFGLGHHRVLFAWSVLHWILSAVILTALAMFALDALEVRRTVTPRLATNFLLTSGRTAIVGLLLAVYAAIAGILVFRSVRKTAKGKDGAGALLVGRAAT